LFFTSSWSLFTGRRPTRPGVFEDLTNQFSDHIQRVIAVITFDCIGCRNSVSGLDYFIVKGDHIEAGSNTQILVQTNTEDPAESVAVFHFKPVILSDHFHESLVIFFRVRIEIHRLLGAHDGYLLLNVVFGRIISTLVDKRIADFVRSGEIGDPLTSGFLEFDFTVAGPVTFAGSIASSFLQAVAFLALL
jgi:hypothetical protein